MKKLFILVIILLFSIVSMGQLKNAGLFKIQNSTETFGWNVPAGTIIIDLSNGDTYRSIAPIASTGTISTALSSLVIDSTYVDIVEFGALNDGVTDNTTAIQAAIDHAITTQGVLISSKGGDFVTGNLVLDSPSNVTINLEGSRLILNGTASGNGLGLEVRGDATGLIIRNTTIVGDSTTVSKHKGVWSDSGVTWKNVIIENNRISGTINGISVNANLSGLIENVNIRNNNISYIVGTTSGYGYGIHWAYPNATSTSVICTDNVISYCQRHSIYCAAGGHSLISGNNISYHRFGVADATVRAAITVLRGEYIEVSNNLIDRCYDGYINIAESESSTANTRHVIVKNNYFKNKANVVQFITIGEENWPKTYQTSDVIIENNTLYQNCSVYDGGYFVSLLGGERIRFLDNDMVMDSTTAQTYYFIKYGSNSIDSITDFTDVTTYNNKFYANGSFNLVYAFLINDTTSADTSYHTFYKNYLLSDITEFRSNVSITNTNFKRLYNAKTYEENTFSGAQTISNSGDGAELLIFDFERDWKFVQRGSGDSSYLSLEDASGGKSFILRDAFNDKNIAILASGGGVNSTTFYYDGTTRLVVDDEGIDVTNLKVNGVDFGNPITQITSSGAKTSSFSHDCSTNSVGAYTLSSATDIDVDLYNLTPTSSSTFMGTIFIKIGASVPTSLTVNTYSDTGSTSITKEDSSVPVYTTDDTVAITYSAINNGTSTIVYLNYKLF